MSIYTAPVGLVSGEQRVQTAKTKAQQNHAFLERELQRRKEQMRAATVLPSVQIKEEPLSEEEADGAELEAEEEEPMDTAPSTCLSTKLANGLPAGRAVGGDSLNGHPVPGCASNPVACELKAFVEATFQRQFVLTLSELKRLFNLHLAGLPPGHILFSGVSDRMLQDTVLAAGCKQILVPVSKTCVCQDRVNQSPSGGQLGGLRLLRNQACGEICVSWLHLSVLGTVAVSLRVDRVHVVFTRWLCESQGSLSSSEVGVLVSYHRKVSLIGP